jgi:hypothetical protein
MQRRGCDDVVRRLSVVLVVAASGRQPATGSRGSLAGMTSISLHVESLVEYDQPTPMMVFTFFVLLSRCGLCE